MLSSDRLRRGVQRPGRRPTASQDFPVCIHVGQNPHETVLEVDGVVVGPVKKISFTAEVNPETGFLEQILDLVLLDSDVQSTRVELVDRLHEMTDSQPGFDLKLDIVPVNEGPDAAG